LALDAIQQRLFAVALGLRSLRTTASDGDVEAELARLEGEVDGVIKDVRARALVYQPGWLNRCGPPPTSYAPGSASHGREGVGATQGGRRR
jgi:hypothetical protein